MPKRVVASVSVAAGLILALVGCTNPYDPGQRAVGGGLIGAGTGAAIGGAVGGGHGAAIGAAVGGAAYAGAGVVRRHPVLAKLALVLGAILVFTPADRRPQVVKWAAVGVAVCAVLVVGFVALLLILGVTASPSAPSAAPSVAPAACVWGSLC